MQEKEIKDVRIEKEKRGIICRCVWTFTKCIKFLKIRKRESNLFLMGKNHEQTLYDTVFLNDQEHVKFFLISIPVRYEFKSHPPERANIEKTDNIKYFLRYRATGTVICDLWE